MESAELGNIMETMKCNLDPQTTPEQKFATFQQALGEILRVSKDDMKQMLADEKTASRGKPKRGPKPSAK